MGLLSGALQMLTLPPPPPPLPLATHTLLTPTNPFFLCLLLQLQTRSASEENPECHVNREPPHHAPLGPRTHVTWHDPSHRYGYPPVAKALPHWVSSFFCLLLFLSHSYSHTNSFLPYERPPCSLSSKWQPVQSDTCTQPPDTSRSLIYQKQI